MLCYIKSPVSSGIEFHMLEDNLILFLQHWSVERFGMLGRQETITLANLKSSKTVQCDP